jgi:hypothetical protein
MWRYGVMPVSGQDNRPVKTSSCGRYEGLDGLDRSSASPIRLWDPAYRN